MKDGPLKPVSFSTMAMAYDTRGSKLGHPPMYIQIGSPYIPHKNPLRLLHFSFRSIALQHEQTEYLVKYVTRVRYKVTVFPDQKNKVTVSESYRYKKLPFLGRKLLFFVIKLPFL